MQKLSRLWRKSASATPKHTELDAQTIIWAYRLFLDRDPENDRVIQQKLETHGTYQELRRTFLTSNEFKNKNEGFRSITLNGHEPPMVIETQVSDAHLQTLIEHIQKTWQHLGETEPHWSVIVSERFRQTNINQAQVKQEFYETGRRDVDTLLKTLRRNGIDPDALATCLEYGCGVGRLTRWLAEQSPTVYGYDISLPHLTLAQEALTEASVSNVKLRHIRTFHDIDAFPNVDLVYTIIVLQHNPPPIIAYILRRLIRALNPGGVAVFQVPTYRLGYEFSLQRYLAKEAKRREMEMHVLPQRAVFSIVAEEGGRVLEVIEDGWTGLQPGELSNTFVVQKLLE